MKSTAAFILSVLLIILILVLNTAAVFREIGKETMAVPDGRVNVVLDAGHGGEDGGAVSITGTAEKDINLAVAVKTAQVLAFCGVPTVLTRSSDEIDYPPEAETTRERKAWDTKNRVEIINSVPNAVLVSIHQNKYGENNSVHGAQVFYAGTEKSGEFAGIMTEAFGKAADTVRPPAEITGGVYIMTHVNCPAVLIECGFLSNEKEAALLETEGYQLKLAAAAASGIMEFAGKCAGGANET